MHSWYIFGLYILTHEMSISMQRISFVIVPILQDKIGARPISNAGHYGTQQCQKDVGWIPSGSELSISDYRNLITVKNWHAQLVYILSINIKQAMSTTVKLLIWDAH